MTTTPRQPAAPAPDPDPGPIARRLDHLFRTVHPRDRGPYTHKEAAEAINAAAGEQVISPAYLWQLRKGTRTEPGHKRLVAIAKFFGVDVTYFTDDQTAAHAASIVAPPRSPPARPRARRTPGGPWSGIRSATARYPAIRSAREQQPNGGRR
ncbi:hypothetical protein SAMN04489712_105516 [Thermomonospora echinospora]|uniref:HTH cro/C1-type domain-containing protein n=1 Tax=Thermomonospora echinospora TaxID=1992 RepID=A0A1H6AK69_9ACTN|nr:helix-turn-helix transcriptional regulator [Thermomonospora echinospora]SEG49129.1 hypothetical protein SAMN04489712_105516 [Thermomonospora echinospora]